jgi:hypothetical protein
MNNFLFGNQRFGFMKPFVVELGLGRDLMARMPSIRI